MKKLVLCALMFIMSVSFVEVGAYAAEDLDTTITKTAQYVSQTVTNPQIASIGGDWAVFALSRYGYDNDEFYNTYYKNVSDAVKESNSEYVGEFSTDSSRVVIALSSAGYDATNVAGKNLYLPLEDYDYVIERGVNGASYALIAFDSTGYVIANEEATNSREKMIEYILSKKVPRGGWAMGGNVADFDMTAMAIQALAPYYESDDAVKTAINDALLMLSQRQSATGGYVSWGASTAEACAQIICALSSIGVDIEDERFVKEGNTLLDALLSFYDEQTGAFSHIINTPINQMATEQAMYAMVAYNRAANSSAGLYDFSDVTERSYFENTEPEDEDVFIGYWDGYEEDEEYEEDTQENVKEEEKEEEEVTEPPADKNEIKINAEFTDIYGCEFSDEIKELAKKGIITGKSESIFEPYSNMTRAEYATIIVRSFNLVGGENVFSDVMQSDWFYPYVVSAYANGIINGVSKTEFAPQKNITREEAALMCTRAAKLFSAAANIKEKQIQNILSQFDDYKSVSPWAQEGMAFCYANGILKDDTMEIKPQQYVDRGEIAYMIFNLLRVKNYEN